MNSDTLILIVEGTRTWSCFLKTPQIMSVNNYKVLNFEMQTIFLLEEAIMNLCLNRFDNSVRVLPIQINYNHFVRP